MNKFFVKKKYQAKMYKLKSFLLLDQMIIEIVEKIQSFESFRLSFQTCSTLFL